MPSNASRTYRALTAFLVVLALAAGGLSIAVLMARTAEARPVSVSLEPATEPGTSPFVPSLTSGDEPATDDATPVAAADTPGTGDLYTCDPQLLIDYLGAHPDAAAAWVAALDSDPTLSWSGGDTITVEQIPAYIGELTPAVLGDDMRVTNYRFTGGSAGSVQSVLQKDTAVLMDAKGVPRVRCACGNPLTPARAIAGDIEYEGEAWSDFAPVDITVDDPSDEAGGDSGSHPSCDRHQRWDGDRCTDVRRCPPHLQLGDDGRCHRDTTPCPPGLTHDPRGVCRPDGTLPPCPDGAAARTDRPCGPPVCPPAVPTAAGLLLAVVCPPPPVPAAPVPPAGTTTPPPAAGTPPVVGGPPAPVPPAVPADPAVPPVDLAPSPVEPSPVEPSPVEPSPVEPGPVVPPGPTAEGAPVDPITPPPADVGPAPEPDPVPDPQPVEPAVPAAVPAGAGAPDCAVTAADGTCPPPV